MPIESSDLAALSRLLDEALDLEPSQVEPWLDALPQQHRHLVPRLRDMLAEHLRADDAAFMSSGPKLDDRPDALSATAGGLVGPYRLIREIGRGGMGLVWLAQRADGSFKRQVALKLPRLVWGAGLAERMARERDIGALLEHPNIARLYDAGVDSLGRPYLALEYIDGQAIDAWCKARALTVPARLRLFLQVARAVAYAHGRLVVHRDLKPSNVLVTSDGQTHLLDFGIAKLLDDAAESQGGLTQEQGRVLTPHYASPEQLRGEAITVRSDVYSLGVLLFELLTGRIPYETHGKGLAGLEHAMLQSDAALASGKAEDKVARALRGEIDAILAKALQREPALRYATADALADDIERHLSGERVLAQPDRMVYRLAKAVRRHRVMFAAVGAVTLTVLGGAGFSIVQAQRATDAAERARAVKDFVVDVFKVNERGNPANAELRQVPVEVLLERGAKLIETKFAGDAKLQAELYGVVAGIFADISSLELAAQYAEKHVAALEALGATGDARARALTLQAWALAEQGYRRDAEVLARQAVAAARGWPDAQIDARLVLVNVLIRQSRDKEVLDELDGIDADLKSRALESSLPAAKSLANRAFVTAFRGRLGDAVPMYARAIDTGLRIEGPLSRVAIDCHLRLARHYLEFERADEAKTHMAAAIAALRARGGADEFQAAMAEAMTASAMAMTWSHGKRLLPYREAHATLQRIESELVAKGGQVPTLILTLVRFDLGVLDLSWGNVEQGYALIVPAADEMRGTWAIYPWASQRIPHVLGVAELEHGNHAQADRLLHESMEWSRQVRRSNLSDAYIHLVRNSWMRGRYQEADGHLKSILDAKSRQEPDSPPLPSDKQLLLARVELDLVRGNPSAALALVPAWQEDADDDAFSDRRLLRGAALCALGRTREGLPMMEDHLVRLGDEFSANNPQLARWRSMTALCALHAGKRGRAAQLFDLSRAAFESQPGVSPYYKAPQAQLAAKLVKPAAGAR